MSGTQVQFLGAEWESHMPRGTAKKKKIELKNTKLPSFIQWEKPAVEKHVCIKCHSLHMCTRAYI